jgi:hypothetical protein
MEAVKCISLSRRVSSGSYSSTHITSFLIHTSEASDTQTSFLRFIIHSRVWKLQFDTHICRGDFAKVAFTKLTLQTLGVLLQNGGLSGKVHFKMEKLWLALEGFFLFFFFKHTDKPYFPFVEILSGTLCSYQRWRQDVPSPWSLGFWIQVMASEGALHGCGLGQNCSMSCVQVFSNLTKGIY